MPQPPITKIHLKITYLKFHSNFPGANELKIFDAWFIHAGSYVEQWTKAEEIDNQMLVHAMTAQL